MFDCVVIEQIELVAAFTWLYSLMVTFFKWLLITNAFFFFPFLLIV